LPGISGKKIKTTVTINKKYEQKDNRADVDDGGNMPFGIFTVPTPGFRGNKNRGVEQSNILHSQE